MTAPTRKDFGGRQAAPIAAIVLSIDWMSRERTEHGRRSRHGRHEMINCKNDARID